MGGRKKIPRQGDLFSGFESEKQIGAKDVCKVFGGRVLTEAEFEEKCKKAEYEERERRGWYLFKQLERDGIFEPYAPDPEKYDPTECQNYCPDCEPGKSCRFVNRIKAAGARRQAGE